MSLDGKYKFIEEKLKKANIKLFQYLSPLEMNYIDLAENDKVLVEPVTFDKYQKIGDFFVELPTVPRMVGKVIKSNIDNIKVGDKILYTNNYVAFRYFINVEDETKIYLSIPNEDIIMINYKYM